MFVVHGSGHWRRKDIKKQTLLFDAAEDTMTKMVALGYKEVYITNVGECNPGYDTLTSSELSRDRHLTKRIKVARLDQTVINVRLGELLLKNIAHLADACGQSQNAFIVDAVRFGLDENLADKPVSLADFSAATANKQQYCIRLPKGTLELVDKRVKTIGGSRSAWVTWALMSHLDRASKQVMN